MRLFPTAILTTILIVADTVIIKAAILETVVMGTMPASMCNAWALVLRNGEQASIPQLLPL